MRTAISFLHREVEDIERETVNFFAMLDDRRICCRISCEALEELAGSSIEDLVGCFTGNRFPIEAIAKELIGWNRFEADGTILIRSADVRALRRKVGQRDLSCG